MTCVSVKAYNYKCMTKDSGDIAKRGHGPVYTQYCKVHATWYLYLYRTHWIQIVSAVTSTVRECVNHLNLLQIRS